ncbi:MAG: Sigma 54 modulation protein / ribosomal protein [Planctomycetota bacterium]|nr:Sigma 54 modulation protein / ribosomal protein [Planctomycetota bacterium]
MSRGDGIRVAIQSDRGLISPLNEVIHMQVQVHTDNHISGREALVDRVETEVEGTLSRFAGRLTRVEVFLSDENGPKHGSDDKRCLMEARIAGHQPLTVTHHAATLDEAIAGAALKLEHNLDHTLGKLHDPKGRLSYSGE